MKMWTREVSVLLLCRFTRHHFLTSYRHVYEDGEDDSPRWLAASVSLAKLSLLSVRGAAHACRDSERAVLRIAPGSDVAATRQFAG